MNNNSNATWKLSETGECLCAGSGLLFFKNKKPQGISFETIMQMIKDDPDNDAYVQVRKRKLTLGKALALDQVDKLGQEINLSTTISLHTIRHDRNFEVLPDTGKQLIKNIYESKPYTINEE